MLIELATSPLGADIDHIGDHLLVFGDRVELHDRNGRVRQTLDGSQITDVVVQRRFTGAVLSVEGGNGEVITTKGIKPEQADQARSLILKRTRQGRPTLTGPAGGRAPARSNRHDTGTDEPIGAETPEASTPAGRLAILNRGRLNEADLLRKLADLHRVGVLSDAEFESKIALVGRLVGDDPLVSSEHP